MLEKEYADLETKIQNNFRRIERKLSSETGIVVNQDHEHEHNSDVPCSSYEGKNENILNLLRVLQTKMLLKVKYE